MVHDIQRGPHWESVGDTPPTHRAGTLLSSSLETKLAAFFNFGSGWGGGPSDSQTYISR